jgi:hypothetical protein
MERNQETMKSAWRKIAFGIVLATLANSVLADDLDELRKLRDTTINLVNALVEQGVLTRAKADEIIAQAQQAAAKPGAPAAGASAAASAGNAPAGTPPPAAPTGAAPEAAPGVVRVPYVPESVKQEIRDEVKGEVLAQAKTERWGEPGAFPDWLQRFTWDGDMRLRFEADRFPNDGTPNAPVTTLQPNGVNIANSTESDNRYRFRARFGFEATVADTVQVGMRVASGGVGAGGNPASENQTLGTYAARETLGFDRAYIQYRPESWLTLTGGRLGNPFFEPTTLIWANDFSFEGFAARIDPQLGPRTTWFTTIGAFPILQNDPTSTSRSPSKWLYAYQTGLDLRLTEMAKWTFAAALYDYRNIEGIPNPYIPNNPNTEYSATAAPFRQIGNTVFDINYLADEQNPNNAPLYGLVSKFHELNLSSKIDIGFVGPTHIIFDADWVKNLGFNENEIIARTGFAVDKQIRGWQSKLTVGYPTMARKFSWQAWVGYRYAQRDSTVDAFTDADFHLGGTDAMGYFLGGSFAFEKNTFLSLRWFSAKQIDGVEIVPATLSGLPLAIDVLQVDVNAAF